ncbi:MAG: relaxase/mobilization nuclease domain-containing protein [Solirubrobacteraceae bacterium]
MIPNITRGGRMGGLLVYLAGPGRGNEHSEPHLVAGDPGVMAWHADEELSRAAALRIAGVLDHPRRAFGTRVSVPVKDREGHHRGVKDAHVWHCSLSLHADEGQISEERWAQIAEELVAGMGFARAEGKAACRWVALRHGISKAGNDHLHVVVSLVGEDGTKASTWNDRPRAQTLAGELELKHGLLVLESRQAGRGSRGEKPAEREIARRDHVQELPRERLERTVRACAAAAGDEAEFVRRLRAGGLRVRPRFAAGRGDVVAGYSVALGSPAGRAVVWFGGGRLARDLTLPRLRAGWADSPALAGAAVSEWTAAGRNLPPGAPGREAVEPDPALWARYSTEVGALRDRLRSVPVDDLATWAHVAQESAGAFAAWSHAVEAQPGPLAATARVLARSSELRAWQTSGKRAAVPSARGAALLLASAARGGSGPVAQAVLLRQLANLAKALYDMHRAAGDAQRAGEIELAVREQLVLVSDRLTAAQGPGERGGDRQALEAARAAGQGQLAPRPGGSPIPSRLPDQPSRPAVPRPPVPKRSDIER